MTKLFGMMMLCLLLELHLAVIGVKKKTKVSIDDIIHAQTFPEDYNFNPRNYSQVGYICGMSVPPIMIKRIVTRLIEQGVFDG